MELIKKYKGFFPVILLFLSLFVILFIVVNNSSRYTEKYNHAIFEKKYLASQWRVPNSKHPISDEELFTFGGYEFVRGENPILITPEYAPLGRYLVGLSIYFFSNQRVFSIIFALITLTLVFIIIFNETRSALFSSLGVFLTATNTLFVDQIIYSPQLDIFHVSFFLLTAFFLLRYEKNKKIHHILFAGVVYGFLLSTKVFLQSFGLMVVFLPLIFYFSENDLKEAFKKFIFLTVVGLSVFVLTYFSYFLHGGSLRGLLGVQKWILEFYRSSSIDMKKLFGTYIGLVLFNRWKFWTEGYPIISFDKWSWTWPLLFLGGLITSVKVFITKNKQSFAMRYFATWTVLYAVSLLFVPVFPRYLLLLFVPMIILISLYAQKIIKI